MLKIPPGRTKEEAKAIRSEWTKTLRQLQKQSQIRRGEQGRGAHEPDVVTPTPWWLELSRKHDPGALAAKLAQGKRDMGEAQAHGKAWFRAAALCRKTGSPEIRVMLAAEDLVDALGDSAVKWPVWAWDMPIVISYDYFLQLLEEDHARGTRS